MSQSIIEVENIGKAYRLGERQEEGSLRDAIVNLIKAPLRRIRAVSEAAEDNSFWALRNINFKVGQGEVLGIIGRNGAGKSTLLKILSRITEPTEGHAILRGRMASLLEVGTGFHPELSGRENIYFNGAIRGMTRREIKQKFNSIVDFAEVDQFLDTPVKRYSSGMYVRLAFAVAAHLEPEILIVDEVLAVGDAQFQAKCLGKMHDFAEGTGRTVLFVSHNMPAVEKLCSRAILLRKGELVMDGPTPEVIQGYMGYMREAAKGSLEDHPERSGSGEVRLTSAVMLDESGETTERLVAGRRASLRVRYRNPGNVRKVHIACTFFNQSGVGVVAMHSDLTGYTIDNLADVGEIYLHLDRLPLNLGEYRISIAVKQATEMLDLIPSAVLFTVEQSSFYASAKTPEPRYSLVMVDHRFEHCPGVGDSETPPDRESTSDTATGEANNSNEANHDSNQSVDVA